MTARRVTRLAATVPVALARDTARNLTGPGRTATRTARTAATAARALTGRRDRVHAARLAYATTTHPTSRPSGRTDGTRP